MNVSLDNEIRDILLAINTNTKLNIQIVITTNYKKNSKRLNTKFGIEHLRRTKYFDEDTKKNKYQYLVYKNELIKTKYGLLKRLGEIYQEQVDKEVREQEQKNKKRSKGGDE